MRPDGAGLPEGSGTVAHGKEVYQDNCEAVMAPMAKADSTIVSSVARVRSPRIIRSRQWAATGHMQRPCSTTFAAPCPILHPSALSVDDTYAVAAYILNLNGILPADGKLDQHTLPKIKMPNRDGFIPDPVFMLDNEPEATPSCQGEAAGLLPTPRR